MNNLEKSNCLKEHLAPDSVLTFIKNIEEIIEPHGIVIIKNGKIILDAKWEPYSTARPHAVNSVTKTFIGIAIGLLYDKGLIRLEDNVISFFPEVKIDLHNTQVREMTIKNVLTMSMGQITTPILDADRSWVSALLNNPVTYTPGSMFHYDSLASYLLSAIYTKVKGESVAAGLQRELFMPLGIENAYFFDNKEGITIGGLGLFIPTIGLAKTGYMLMNHGVYAGHRILSEEWCQMQLAKQIDNAAAFAPSKHESRQGYGFQCWHCVNGGVRMSGLWGQMCLMMPEYNFVMAINARGSSSQPVLDIFNKTILPALQDGDIEGSQCELDNYLSTRKVTINNNDFTSYMKDIINNKEVTVSADDIYDVSRFKLTFENDLLLFEVERKNKTYSCIYQQNCLGKGKSNIVDLFPPYYDSLAKPKNELLNYHEPVCFAQYIWEDEGTLLLTALFDNEATHFIIRIHFDYEYAAFEWQPLSCFTKYEHVIVHGRYV